MPWYWSDEIARVLLDLGKIDARGAAAFISAPVAFRSQAETIEGAADALLEEDEIPLLAA